MVTDGQLVSLDELYTMNKYLPMYLMTFGTAIRIREPLELKRQIQELAYGIAKHYDEDSG